MAEYTKELIQTKGLPFVMAYLLPVVAQTSTITYGEVARRLEVDLKLGGRVFSTHIGGVAGALMDKLHDVDDEIPLINALIVSQDIKQPSRGMDSYLRRWFGVDGDPYEYLEPELKDELVSRAVKQVYAYPHWKRVYKQAFGKNPPQGVPSRLPVGAEQDGKTKSGGGWGGEAESAEHKALKAHVHANPRLVGVTGTPDISEPEKRLLSFDEVDVFFQKGSMAYLVEVKSRRSNEADLQRGVYQCVKYRAVFLAQCKKVMPDMEARAILAVEEHPSPDIMALAKMHGIKVKVIDMT